MDIDLKKLRELVDRVQHEFRAEPTSQYVYSGIPCVHDEDCLYCALIAEIAALEAKG